MAGKTFSATVESLNKAILIIEMTTVPSHGHFLYLSLVTWGLPKAEIDALEARFQAIIDGSSRSRPSRPMAACARGGGRVPAGSTRLEPWAERGRVRAPDDPARPPIPSASAMRGQRIDDELDVLLQRDAEPLDARVDIFAADLRRKALVLQFLLDARWGERADAIGADEAAGHDEAGQLVAGEQGLVESGQLGDFRAASKWATTAWAISGSPCSRSQRDDPPRVLFGPSVVVGVVHKPGHRPSRLVGRAGAVAMRGPSHRRLDPRGMVPAAPGCPSTRGASPPHPRKLIAMDRSSRASNRGSPSGQSIRIGLETGWVRGPRRSRTARAGGGRDRRLRHRDRAGDVLALNRTSEAGRGRQEPTEQGKTLGVPLGERAWIAAAIRAGQPTTTSASPSHTACELPRA